MRGSDALQEALFTFSKLEDFVPDDHPLRAVKNLVNESLQRLTGCSIRSMPTAGAPRWLPRS